MIWELFGFLGFMIEKMMNMVEEEDEDEQFAGFLHGFLFFNYFLG